MSTAIEVAEKPLQRYLATPDTEPETFRILDVYSDNGVVEVTQPRIDAIATISAGAMEEGKSHPTISRDGTICLHDPEGRAPGLKAALEAGGNKRLMIAFPSHNRSDFIQQRFTEYSKTALICYGDEHGIKYIRKTTDDAGKVVSSEHEFHAVGTEGFNILKKRCKVSTSVFFHLAEWNDLDDPSVVFPDGLGFYRLRFTSRNSMRNLLAAIDTITRYTGGRIAGIPLELSISNRDSVSPDGTKRKVPVFQFLMRPPGGHRMTSKNFRMIADRSLQEGAALMLPPARETIEHAALEAPTIDMDEAAVEAVEQGGYCDAEHWNKRFWAECKGSDLDNDDARANFMEMATNKRFNSLSAFLAQATEEEADALIQNAITYLLETGQRKYDLTGMSEVDLKALVAHLQNVNSNHPQRDEIMSRLAELLPPPEPRKSEPTPEPAAEALVAEPTEVVFPNGPHQGKHPRELKTDSLEKMLAKIPEKSEKLKPLAAAIREVLAERAAAQPAEDEAVSFDDDDAPIEGDVSPVPEPQSEPALKKDLYTEVSKKGEAAKQDAADDDGAFDQPEEPPAPTTPTISGELSAMAQNVVEAAMAKDLPVDEATMNGPALDAINTFLADAGMRQLKRFADMKSISGSKVVLAVESGEIKWEAK